ncbi:MAG: hypothetical protein AB1421_03515 [Pseudomonadota bacterium]
MMRAEHWLMRELKKAMIMAKDPLAWVMTLALVVGGGLMLWFLLTATDNFGAYYTLPYACSKSFSEMRLFLLTMLAPLFFIAVVVTMAELSVVLGLRKKKRGKVDYKFLLTALVSMLVLGAISFVLLSC